MAFNPIAAAAAARSLQSCLTLFDPRDGSLPGSPIPGILQARTLEWVAIKQDSSLENSIDRGAWQATVYRIKKLDVT